MRTSNPLLSSLFLCAAILLQWGCAPEPETRIDRDTFIDVYVDLRVAALEHQDAVIREEDRDRILSTHQVTVDELVEFAEVRGRDPAFMEGVWEEIETRLNVDTLSTS